MGTRPAYRSLFGALQYIFIELNVKPDLGRRYLELSVPTAVTLGKQIC
jgi:hypothetical protein